MNIADPVYRHFADPEMLAQYLAGVWSGCGLQGVPTVHPDVESKLSLSVRRDGLTITVRGQMAGKGLRSKRRGAGQRFASLPGLALSMSATFVLGTGVPHIETDYAQYGTGVTVTLRIQALQDGRAHAVLNDENGGLLFAGVIKRSRLRSLFVS